MILYIIRHAWAEERDAERFPNDDVRPLTPKGRKRFAKFVRDVADAGFQPRAIATSPLVRCRETADIIVHVADEEPRLVELDALRPHSNLDELIKWTAEQQEAEVAWVGHAPDVDELTASLIGNGDAQFQFAKGAVAAIQFDQVPEPGAGTLLWLATAKLLGR